MGLAIYKNHDSGANKLANYKGANTGSQFKATSASPQGKNFSDVIRCDGLGSLVATLGTAPVAGNQDICLFAGTVTRGSGANVSWGTGQNITGNGGGGSTQSVGNDVMVWNSTTIAVLVSDIHAAALDNYTINTFTVSGNSITPDQVYTGIGPCYSTTYLWPKIVRLSDTRALVVYNDNTTGYYTAIGINFNGHGNALTKDSSSVVIESVVPNNGSNDNFSLRPTGSASAIMAWKSSINSAKPKFITLTDSGSAISAGTATQFGAALTTATNCMPAVFATSKAFLLKANIANGNGTSAVIKLQPGLLSSGSVSAVSSNTDIAGPVPNLLSVDSNGNSSYSYKIAEIGDINGDGTQWFMEVVGNSSGDRSFPTGTMWGVFYGINTNSGGTALENMQYALIELASGLTADWDGMRNNIYSVGSIALDTSTVVIIWGYSDGGATNVYWNSIVIGF